MGCLKESNGVFERERCFKKSFIYNTFSLSFNHRAIRALQITSERGENPVDNFSPRIGVRMTFKKMVVFIF